MKKNIISKMTSFIISTALIISAFPSLTAVNASSGDYNFEYKNSLSPDSQIIYDGLAFLADPREETVHINLPEAIEIKFSDNTSSTMTDEQFLESSIVDVINPGFQFLLLDKPEIFWIEDNPTFSYEYTIKTDEYTGEEIYSVKDIYFNFTIGESFNNDLQFARQCKEELNQALYSFQVEGETRYDKVKSIHDQLIESIEYDSSKNQMNYSAYGALVNHQAACQGYSQAFKLLCNREGIPCIAVLLDEEHMWNYVQMDDGQWYVVDVTRDDYNFVEHIIGTGISYEYFLKGIESMFSKNRIAPKSNYGIANHLPDPFMKDYECDPVSDCTEPSEEPTEPTTEFIEPVVYTPEEIADRDGDGIVSASDAIVCASIILSYDSDSECDINNDNCTNSFDLITLKRIMKKGMSNC